MDPVSTIDEPESAKHMLMLHLAVFIAERERDEARACLREAINTFGELCAGGEAYERWRKAAGLDAPTNRNIEKGGA